MLDSYTILFAEDEDQTRENIGEILSLMCKNVFLAKDGKEALQLYKQRTPDIIILDIEMPYFTGLEVIEQIREENHNIPIIISTAYTHTDYFLKAIELNLTSYILKPLSATALKDALKKCVYRLNVNQDKTIYFNGSCYYDMKTRTLFNNDREVVLRKSEMQFLEYLLKNPNRAISYEEFEVNLWEEGMSHSAIRSLVRDIRKYLPDNTILNIARFGYKIAVKQ